eukprot:TRINITY_DN371_c0_g1_i1.p1 TRINITY_DN371_c0_g1~~TRINITY_DN371_c0_g1_i1.p1  ORF type:complete len:684 (+),score=84.03 TRINITY_DN371_c0_g1_i1:155-2206(+)
MQIEIPRLLFCKDDVCIDHAGARVCGQLRIFDEGRGETPLLSLVWIPTAGLTASDLSVAAIEHDTSIKSPSVAIKSPSVATEHPDALFPVPPAHDPSALESRQIAVSGEFIFVDAQTAQESEVECIRIPLSNFASLRKHTGSSDAASLKISLQDGRSLPAFYFNSGGMQDLLFQLESIMVLDRSATDPSLFIANARPPGTPPPSPQRIITQLPRQQTLPGSSFKDALNDLGDVVASAAVSTVEASLKDLGYNFLEKISKLTQVVRDTRDQVFNSSFNERPRPALMPHTAAVVPSPETVSELTTVGSFELLPQPTLQQLRPSVTPPPLPPRVHRPPSRNISPVKEFSSLPLPHRGPPLSLLSWQDHLDEEGRVKDPDTVREIIFFGGCDPDVRAMVWPFLLSVYPWRSTLSERKRIRAEHILEYSQLKAQWMTISPQQEARFAKFRDRRHRIEKDVERTDRHHPAFKDDHSETMVKLHNILLTYAIFNFDLGYCQGMSDLVSPLLFVLQDEVNAYWAFVRLMERAEPNFQRDQRGISRQLNSIKRLLQALDPELHEFFMGDEDSQRFFFCFRWVLVVFKREFSFDDIQRVWEVFWTNWLTSDMHLFCAIALLKQHRQQFLQKRMAFDEMLAYINEQSGRIDATQMLLDAETLVYQAQAMSVSSSLPEDDPGPISPDYRSTLQDD